MSFVDESRELFERIADAAFNTLAADEELNLSLSAKDQHYVRFNRAQIRQATAVAQRRLSLDFQKNRRSLRLSLDLSGRSADDIAAVSSLLERGRAETKVLPEDPFAVATSNHGSSDSHYASDYPVAEAWMAEIAEAAAGLDFAGLLAAGPQIRATRNSAGQNHWFSNDSFFIDYSLFTLNTAGENKAVKGLHAGRNWQAEAFAAALAADRLTLEQLRRPTTSLPPGEYRVYLSPHAMEAIVSMFSWGAVSCDAWKQGGCALQKLIDGEANFSEQFSLIENFNLGLGPRFSHLGEVGPEQLAIIEQGQLKNLLVNARSAKEYGLTGNGADSGETLRSPEVRPGTLAEADALKALGDGVYLGNLHYLNWSDPQTARLTGMTRYACFRVESGEIAEPIRDLRFDESLYRMFGSSLEALTRESRLFPSTDTYGQRALGGCQVPGALINAFRFTF
jgi:predicted Zn-dependent protease